MDIGSGGEGEESVWFMGWFSQGMWSEVQLLNIQYASKFPTWDNTFNS